MGDAIRYRQYHTGDESDSLDDFLNINESWSKQDVVLFTSCVTCGLNFDIVHHFDMVGIYAAQVSIRMYAYINQAVVSH